LIIPYGNEIIGEEYENLKTVKNTVITKSPQNKEESHKPLIDAILDKQN